MVGIMRNNVCTSITIGGLKWDTIFSLNIIKFTSIFFFWKGSVGFL